MPTRDVGPWKGQDNRGVYDSADPKTLRVAINVDMLTDGTYQERGGWRKVATVDANSRGLYSVGGSLRCVLAAGHSKNGSVQATVPIIYDFVGDGTVYGETTIDRVTSVSSWDADGAIGVYPALVIKRTAAAGGRYEIHWLQDAPLPDVNGTPPPAYVPSTDPVSTKIDVPFIPGPKILKIQEKMVAMDNTNGAIRFCSTVNGIEDWTTEADAGFLPVIKHVTGDRTIQDLSFYDNLMAVMFSDSIQLWRMHPDPALHELVRVLAGPGVQNFGSAINVRGDLYYFSRGVFSSLKQSGWTGQLVDGDIGAPIATQTKAYENEEPIAFWSQGRSAYYCFFGTVAWRYMVSPDSKTRGWTKYEMPPGITVEAAVEHLGEIYIRSGANIYRLEAGYADGSTYTLETHPLKLGIPGWKTIDTLSATITGTPAVKCLPDMRDSTVVDHLFTLAGATPSLNDLGVFETSEAPAFRFTGAIGGTTPFAINMFSLEVRKA